MYRKMEDFFTDWKTEEAATLKIFGSVPDNIKSVKAVENLRSLERLAWHITQTLTEMPIKAGIIDADDLEHKPVPGTFAEIMDSYKKYSNNLVENLRKKWIDDDLSVTVNMYGEQWERGKILFVLVVHQVHHRGQMTALMRVLGLPVPGIYGPSKEEWSQYGMPAME